MYTRSDIKLQASRKWRLIDIIIVIRLDELFVVQHPEGHYYDTHQSPIQMTNGVEA